MNANIQSWFLKLAMTTAMGIGVILPTSAFAQGECGGGACGTPYESGGSAPCICEDNAPCNCAGATGSILINNTDMGDTYQYADDFDIDGWEDDYDNCPFAVNPNQQDSDGDGFGDVCDNCPQVTNAAQLDADGDWIGNLCDEDADNDTVLNIEDTCPLLPNPLQNMDPGQDDNDGDGLGNVCDTDDDNDGLLDLTDPCPLLPGVDNPNDDRCDADADDDGIPDSLDLCPYFAADNNDDNDGDNLGDPCDADLDNDGVPNVADNCHRLANPTQLNADRDGQGDACDPTFCFVVDSDDSGRCLNPASRFRGRPGPDVTLPTGEKMRLRIFTNRPNAPIQYAWRVASIPEGGRLQIANPTGTINYSTPWEFHYQEGRVATFTADVPGDYEVELQTRLHFDDELYPGLRTDKQVMKIKVTGDAVGCSATGNPKSLLPILVIAGLAVFGINRRR